jgi:hypothetical protein
MILSWGLVPLGIPGFDFATAALVSGIIGREIFTILIFVVLKTTTWIGLYALEFYLKKAKLGELHDFLSFNTRNVSSLTRNLYKPALKKSLWHLRMQFLMMSK